MLSWTVYATVCEWKTDHRVEVLVSQLCRVVMSSKIAVCVTVIVYLSSTNLLAHLLFKMQYNREETQPN